MELKEDSLGNIIINVAIEIRSKETRHHQEERETGLVTIIKISFRAVRLLSFEIYFSKLSFDIAEYSDFGGP